MRTLMPRCFDAACSSVTLGSICRFDYGAWYDSSVLTQ